MAGSVLSARGAAVELLLGVTEGGLSLSDQLGGAAFAALAPAERARAQRLALTVLRQVSKADAVLKPHLRKRPPERVQAILRLAVIEMLAEGAAPHGVVHSAVDLTRKTGHGIEKFAGLVNAVLRKAAEEGAAIWARQPPQEMPNWLRGRLMSAYGKQAAMAMEAAHAAGAPLDLTPKDGDAAALAARLRGEALPTGSVRMPPRAQVSDLDGYATGDWWVQDAAAALAAKALAARPGERVLDLCAAPGGKTLQLAATGARVTALDVSDARLNRLRENLERCRLNAEVVVSDALDWHPDAPFDAVLLDAPCSATGTIRRHPDLPFIRDAASLKPLVALQAQLIDSAVALTRPGGRLVVCTCSLLPEEGEALAAAALSRHADLAADPAALALPGVEAAWVGKGGGLRLRPDYWPDRGGMDGFFIAAFRKAGGDGAISR